MAKLFKANLRTKQATWVSGILPQNALAWLAVSEELIFGLDDGTPFNPQLHFYRLANASLSLESFTCQLPELKRVLRTTWDYDEGMNTLYQAVNLNNGSTALVEVNFDAKKCVPVVLSPSVELSDIRVVPTPKRVAI